MRTAVWWLCSSWKRSSYLQKRHLGQSLFGPFSAYSQIRSSTFCNQQEQVMLIPSCMSLWSARDSVIECCRRKHCSSTVAFNLQYLKSLCSYQRQLFLLISARQTAKQETTAWLMNPSIPICQHKSVSVSPARPQPFALWRVCWALHLIRLRTGWQHTPHSQIFLAGHWTLSLAYTVRQKGISDSFLFSCSIVNFIGCKSQRVHLHFHVQYQGLPSELLGMRQAQIIS